MLLLSVGLPACYLLDVHLKAFISFDVEVTQVTGT